MNVFPLCANFTQYEMLKPVTLLELVPPPSLERDWKTTRLPGITPIKALAALAFKLSRIITPAFAFALVFCARLTRAMKVQLLLMD